MSLVAYYQTDVVPVAEPDTWGASLDLGAGHLTSIDRLAFNAGGWDGGNAGDVYWDEVRVASSWSDLLGKLATAPYPSSVTINGGADVTDAQVAGGSFPVVMTLYDSYGVSVSGSSPSFQPNFDLFNTTGDQITGDEVFNSFQFSDSGRTLTASDTTHGAVSASLIGLGSYTARVSAVNSNYASVIDRATLSNGTAMAFTVIDDDTSGPVLSGFGVLGVALEGASFSTTALGGGLAVTGQTRDAQSGVFAGSSNTYVLTRDGAVVESGSLSAGFSSGGALSSAGSLSVTLSAANVQPVGVYTLAVSSVNYDVDRSAGDTETGAASYSFEVVEAVTEVPAPTASVSGDGAEMTRLAWNSLYTNVLVIHRVGTAPSAGPVNGQAYNVGDTIGSADRHRQDDHQRCAHAGTHGARRGVDALLRLPRGRPGRLLHRRRAQREPPRRTRPLNASTRCRTPTPRCWPAWAEGRAGPTAGWWTPATGSCRPTTPTARTTCRASTAIPATRPRPATASRWASARTSPCSRAASSRASPAARSTWPGSWPTASSATQKWCGLSFYNGGSEQAFIGKAGDGQVLAIDSYGGSKVNSGYTLQGTEAWAGGSTGNVYLIIARYNFASKQLDAVAYYRTATVPAAEPSSWAVSATMPGGGISRIDGVRIAGGAYSGNAIGSIWFDEIRVATNWVALFGRDTTYPVPTNLVVNGGSAVTDGQVASGGFTVAMHLWDAYGVDTTGGAPLFQPNFDLFNTAGDQIITDEVFNSFTYSNGGRTLLASDASHGAVAASLIGLGTYTTRVSAVNSNGLTSIDRTTLSNGTAMTFSVIDDDTAGPVASSFNVGGQTYGIDAISGPGLLATGLVQDTGSGVYSASNTYQLYRNGSLADSGAFTVAPSDGGAKAAAAALEVTLPGAAFTELGNYGLVVRTADYDVDRIGDSTTGSNAFYFTVVAGSCPGGIEPTLTQPGHQYITEDGGVLSFNITASDSAGCTAPTFTYSALPSGASFNSTPSGSSRTGTFSWNPDSNQSGTYPIRFTADDGDSTPTSLIIRVYVADTGEATNSAGVPVSQTNWHVSITNIQIPSSGNITVVYAAVNGVAYDVYRSDQNFGGAMTWTKVVDEEVASGSTDLAEVDASVSQRYFQVVLAGGSPSSNGVWAVIRPTINASTFTLVSPGTAGDRKFNGELGTNLAQVLTGNDGGIGNGVGDEAFILNANQSWRNLYLDSQKVWRESNGSVSTYELAVGQGFYILRNGAAAQPRLSGPVGNSGTATNVITDDSGNGAWNIITLSQGKHIAISSAFSSLAEGSLEANWDETQADLVVLQNSDGSWRRIMRAGDNTWFDLSTFAPANFNLSPGTAVYFYRQPAGTLRVRF
jgi:hypothetical protein